MIEKTVRASRDALVRQLVNGGYKVDTFGVESVGRYAIEDADWNYKDVPHLNVVHTQVRCIIGSMDEDHITTINLQKIFGVAVPVVVVNYATAANAQTYYTTLGPFVLVVQTQYEVVEPNVTRVRTEYNVAAKGFPALAFPLLRRILKNNYRTLMSEDLPMRERRGELRDHGFRFKSDGRPRTFAETTDLIHENVVLPSRSDKRTESLAVASLPPNGTSVYIGPNDDRGVRLVLAGEELLVLPRVCMHEGASLDGCEIKNGQAVCPWHAKRISPLMRLPCRAGEERSTESNRVRIVEDVIFLDLPSDAAFADANAAAVASS